MAVTRSMTGTTKKPETMADAVAMVVTRSMAGATKKPETRAEAARAIQKTTGRASKKGKSKRGRKKLTTAEKESRKAKKQEYRQMSNGREVFLATTFRQQYMMKNLKAPGGGAWYGEGFAEWDALSDSAKREYIAITQQPWTYKSKCEYIAKFSVQLPDL